MDTIKLDPIWYSDTPRYFSWSGGKDSTACIILAHRLGIRIDEIIFCQVWYDKHRGIPADINQYDWIHNTAIPRLKDMGYKVTELSSNQDFLSLFKHIKKDGKVAGYPITGKCYMTDRCKTRPITKYTNAHKDWISCIGIASDEPERLARLTGNKRSLLAECGYTELMARNLCEEEGLLSPIYQSVGRGGGAGFVPVKRSQNGRRQGKNTPNYGQSTRLCPLLPILLLNKLGSI